MKPGEASGESPISIWQPRSLGGETAFVRPVPLPLGDHYADRELFFKKKPPGVTRVCFFGESVAAGYLYAPHITPARMLEHLLLEISGKQSFEVIDLARTNETLDGLVATLESSIQLEPDVLVIFTGNNWTMLETPELSPYFPVVGARLELARLLREAGVAGVTDQASLRVLQKSAAAFARIARVAKSAGIPVVLVLPEVNLGDWENRQPPLWLPGNGTATWYRLYQKATADLSQENWTGAIAAAWQMEALDGCYCPTTYRLLARGFSGLGEMHHARAAGQAEVDSNRYPTLGFLGAPQINSGYQTLQKKAAGQHGFFVVDLPEIFRRHTDALLPGRRMFLDYCHLTLEGMQVAMSAVAVEVLRARGSAPNVSREDPAGRLSIPAISPEADATAKFGAAIHTAHRHLATGSGTDILEYWCREALSASPGIRQTMLDFAIARMAQLPALLTAAQHRNFHSPYRLGMQHGLKYDYLDAGLLKTLEKVLDLNVAGWKTVGPTYPDQVDLANPYFLWAPVERFYPEVMQVRDIPGRAFYRAAWPESNFAVFRPPARSLRLELTLRLPAIPGWAQKRQGEVHVRLGGALIGKVKAGENWTKTSLTLRQPLRTACLQPLTLQWPGLPACGNEALEGAIQRLEQGSEADLHPVFGEVFSLTAHHGD